MNFIKNKKSAFNKFYEIYRKKCEQSIGLRYNNFIALERAVYSFWDLRKLISKEVFETALDNLFNNNEALIIKLFKDALDTAINKNNKKLASKD